MEKKKKKEETMAEKNFATIFGTVTPSQKTSRKGIELDKKSSIILEGMVLSSYLKYDSVSLRDIMLSLKGRKEFEIFFRPVSGRESISETSIIRRLEKWFSDHGFVVGMKNGVKVVDPVDTDIETRLVELSQELEEISQVEKS